MKKNSLLLIYAILLSGLTGSMAQKTKTQVGAKSRIQVTDVVLNNFKAMYNNAVMLGDLPTAINAAHYIIAAGDNKYIDSVGILYYNSNLYEQALGIAKVSLKTNPDNIAMYMVSSNALQSLGKMKEAIIYQEKLYQLQPTVPNGFNLMQLQLNMTRLSECIQTGNELLKMGIDSTLTYQYIDADKKTKSTSLNAVVYNTQGVAYNNLKNSGKAKECFQKALQIDPEFELAKLNLTSLKLDESKK